MTIKHTEASLQQSAAERLHRAASDVSQRTRESRAKGLLAGLVLVLLSIAVVVGSHLLF